MIRHAHPPMQARARQGTCIVDYLVEGVAGAIACCCHVRPWREGADAPPACMVCIQGECGNVARVRPMTQEFVDQLRVAYPTNGTDGGS